MTSVTAHVPGMNSPKWLLVRTIALEEIETSAPAARLKLMFFMTGRKNFA
ncbi:hypothetical protein [Symmachiella macrocystis]|nr:hypothetical protein [Symmachiella macrocystis]